MLSHWPHVATQVAAHVASVKGLGHKSLNLLPSPFTLQRHVRRQICVQRRPLANGTDVRSKMRRQLVWRHVASVKALLEGKYWLVQRYSTDGALVEAVNNTRGNHGGNG